MHLVSALPSTLNYQNLISQCESVSAFANSVHYESPLIKSWSAYENLCCGFQSDYNKTKITCGLNDTLVTGIKLHDLDLYGEPDWAILESIPFLSELDMSMNKLEGNLSIYSNLFYLNVSHNEFSWVTFKERINGPLTIFDISYNNVSDISIVDGGLTRALDDQTLCDASSNYIPIENQIPSICACDVFDMRGYKWSIPDDELNITE